VREIKEYNVRVRTGADFMSLRSPIELNNRRERFELCLADYKMISAPEKCLTTVAHQSAPQVSQ
jgi:hypothetical protein